MKALSLALGLLALAGGPVAAVPDGYREVARTEGVPPEILYAVACAESGRRVTGATFKPWPWALNVDGETRFYATRVAAYSDLRRELPRRANIDIGLGQVSWRWHATRLGSPWAALDPYLNLRTAARILREEFERCECEEWWIAVERYHAPSDTAEARERRARYRARVERCVP